MHKTLFYFLSISILFSNSIMADDPCRRGCWDPNQPTPPPAPRPREYKCEVKMVDYYGGALYIYTGISPDYKAACDAAVGRCVKEVRLGYGGSGARCIKLGR